MSLDYFCFVFWGGGWGWGWGWREPGYGEGVPLTNVKQATRLCLGLAVL